MFKAPLLPRTLPAALRDAQSDKARVRLDAVPDLVRHAGEAKEAVLRALEGLVRDEDARVRSAAALALADVGASEALPQLLVATSDPSVEVRQMAITALGELGDPRATERLRRALSDPAPEIRFQAVMAFARVSASPEDVLEALLQAMRDPDPLVVHIALRMSEEAAGAEEGEKLELPAPLLARARALLDHASDAVRVAAAILLCRAGKTGGEEVLARLARAEISTHDAADEAAAIDLVGELGLEAATPGLERRAFARLGRGGRFAWNARVALARMGHARARREILRELASWNRDRRTLAVAAAGRARLEEARPLLEAMRAAPERAEPDAVEEALRALGPARRDA